ncbi:MAG: hypothetical protein HQK54_07185, partial [Oligoflexales bacterium]|nr:hypothetical protein [Oligoflexales bacterium]
MRLTSESVLEIEESTIARMTAIVQNHGMEAACHVCINSARASLQNDKDIIERFFLILWLIENGQGSGIINYTLLNELSKIAEYSLQALGIRPGISRISGLYGKLYKARSRYMQQMNDHWLSMWNHNLSEVMVRFKEESDERHSDENHFISRIAVADCAFYLGYIGEALEAYLQVETRHENTDDIINARFGIIKCQRIFGDLESAEENGIALQKQYPLSHENQTKLDWELAFINTQKSNDPTPLLKAMKEQKLNSMMDYLLMASLFCYAYASKDFIKNLPSTSRLKRQHSSLKKSFDTRHNILFRYNQIIEYCNKTEDSMIGKLKELEECLNEAHHHMVSEEKALFFAAVTRWLSRNRQNRFALFTMNEYIHTSLFLTQGRYHNLYGLLTDIGDKLSIMGQSTRMTNKERSFATSLKRTLITSKLGSRVFLTYLKLKKNEWFSPAERKVYRKDFIDKVSELFVEYGGGELKGPMQKVGLFFLQLNDISDYAEKNFKEVLWSKK